MTSQRIWRALAPSSTPVEALTAAYTIVLSLSCWAGEWFSGGFLPALPRLAGWEPVAAVAGVGVGCTHLWAASTRRYRLRQAFAQWAGAAFAALSALVMMQHGLSIPGGPALALAVCIEGWAYVSLESTIKRSRAYAS